MPALIRRASVSVCSGWRHPRGWPTGVGAASQLVLEDADAGLVHVREAVAGPGLEQFERLPDWVDRHPLAAGGGDRQRDAGARDAFVGGPFGVMRRGLERDHGADTERTADESVSSTGVALAVTAPGGEGMTINPVGKSFKPFESGSSDSFAYMYETSVGVLENKL